MSPLVMGEVVKLGRVVFPYDGFYMLEVIVFVLYKLLMPYKSLSEEIQDRRRCMQNKFLRRIKMNGYTFRGSNSYCHFASHLTRDQLLKKRFAPGGKLFPLRLDPILKGLHCPEKQTENHKSCFPLLK